MQKVKPTATGAPPVAVGHTHKMTSVRCYNRFLLAIMAFAAAGFVAGIVLLILNISMPGTIALLAGVMMGTVAGMEWRCREKPNPIIMVQRPPLPPPLIEVVVVPAPPEIPA